MIHPYSAINRNLKNFNYLRNEFDLLTHYRRQRQQKRKLIKCIECSPSCKIHEHIQHVQYVAQYMHSCVP